MTPPSVPPRPYLGPTPSEVLEQAIRNYGEACASSGQTLAVSGELQDAINDFVAARSRETPAPPGEPDCWHCRKPFSEHAPSGYCPDSPPNEDATGYEPETVERLRQQVDTLLKERSARFLAEPVSLDVFSASPAPTSGVTAEHVRFLKGLDGKTERGDEVLGEIIDCLEATLAAPAPRPDDAAFLQSIVDRFPLAGDGSQRREITLDENDGQALADIARRLASRATATLEAVYRELDRVIDGGYSLNSAEAVRLRDSIAKLASRAPSRETPATPTPRPLSERERNEAQGIEVMRRELTPAAPPAPTSGEPSAAERQHDLYEDRWKTPTGEPSTRLADVRRLVGNALKVRNIDESFTQEQARRADAALDAALVALCGIADAAREAADELEANYRQQYSDGVGGIHVAFQRRFDRDMELVWQLRGDAARAAHTATPAERCPTCGSTERTVANDCAKCGVDLDYRGDSRSESGGAATPPAGEGRA